MATAYNLVSCIVSTVTVVLYLCDGVFVEVFGVCALFVEFEFL